MLSFSGYNTVVRADLPSCQQKRGGGVCFLIANSLQAGQRRDLQVWPESVWIELESQSNPPMVFGFVYRPRSSDVRTFMHNLEDTIEKCHHCTKRGRASYIVREVREVREREREREKERERERETERKRERERERETERERERQRERRTEVMSP